MHCHPLASGSLRAAPRRVRPTLPSTRSGFTLAELTIAIVLLTIGVGALASTAAYVLYETAASRRAEAAANLARTRFDRLRMGACIASSGVEVHAGLTEQWAVTIAPHGASAIAVISYDERGRAVMQRYQTAFRC